MEIGAYDIFIDYALISRFPVISRTVKNLSKGFVAAYLRPSPVVFKADHRHLAQIALQDNIVYQPSRLLLRVQIYQMKPLHPSLICLIIISKKLIASAHGDHHAVILHISLKILLNLLKLPAYQHLLPVGTAAQKHNIKLRKIDRIIQIILDRPGFDPPPLAALHHALDISPVAVKI